MADDLLNENFGADFTQNGYSDEDMVVLSSSQTGTAADYADFQTWNASADGSGNVYNPGSRVRVQSDTSLYAQWKLKGKYLQLERRNCTLSSRGNAGQTTDRGQWTIPVKLDWTETSQWQLNFRVKPTLEQPFYLCKTTAVSYDGSGRTVAGYEVAPETSGFMLPFEIFMLPPQANYGVQWDSSGAFSQFTKSTSNNTRWQLVMASFANPVGDAASSKRPAPQLSGLVATDKAIAAGNANSFRAAAGDKTEWRYSYDSAQCKTFYASTTNDWIDVCIEKDGKNVTTTVKSLTNRNFTGTGTLQLSYVNQKISVPGSSNAADTSHLYLELGGGYQWKENKYTETWHNGFTVGTGRYKTTTTDIPGRRGIWHFYRKEDKTYVKLNSYGCAGGYKANYGAPINCNDTALWYCKNYWNSSQYYTVDQTYEPDIFYRYPETTWPQHVNLDGKQNGHCYFGCYKVYGKDKCQYSSTPSSCSCGVVTTSKTCGYWKEFPTAASQRTSTVEITEYIPGWWSTDIVGTNLIQTAASPGVWWDFGSTSDTYSVLSGEIYFLKA